MTARFKSNQIAPRYKPILMDCRTVQEKILQFLYNELAVEELTEIANHLAECNICSRERAIIVELLEQLKSWQPEEPSPEVKERIKKNIKKNLT